MPDGYWEEGRRALEWADALGIIEFPLDEPLCITDALLRADAVRAFLTLLEASDLPTATGFFDDGGLTPELSAHLEFFKSLGYNPELVWFDPQDEYKFGPFQPVKRDVGGFWLTWYAYQESYPPERSCQEIFRDIPCKGTRQDSFWPYVETIEIDQLYYLDFGPRLYAPDKTFSWVQFLVILKRADEFRQQLALATPTPTPTP